MTTDSKSDENKRIAEEAEGIEIIIRQVKKDTSVFLLTVLQSMINEQIEAKQLKRDVQLHLSGSQRPGHTQKMD